MTAKADPAAETPLAAEPRRRAGVRIIVWLFFAIFAVVALLALLAGLTLSGARSSSDEILKAEQSVLQMENVQRIEAAFNAYLLNEIRRRLTDDPGLAEAPEAARLRGALLAYRRQLAAEIAAARTPEERDAERADIVRAAVMTDIFETVERESLIDRRAEDGSLRRFMDLVAAGRDEVFQNAVAEALTSERNEVETAFAKLEELRVELLTTGGAVAVAFLLALLACFVVFYRGLMRPIRLLTEAVEAAPAAGRRAPEDMPGEFSLLARRFNAMMARIGSERERLQAEVAARTEALETANARLREVDGARRAFFANISHELRTPLTVMLGEAQIALRAAKAGEAETGSAAVGIGGDGDAGEARAALERIAATGGYLRRRMDDLLKLARSEDGALTLEKAPFELREAVEAAARTVRGYARSRGVAVEFAGVEGPELIGDREAVHQAALALLDNAIKFTPAGGAVRAEVTERGFAVLDAGPGFGDVAPETLFDRYAQAQTGKARGGAGLGLAIVKWIADQHGARLVVGDAPGGGARVEMEFGA